MVKRAALVSVALFFGTVVLFTSIFRTTAPEYVFSQPMAKEAMGSSGIEIDYYLAYPGILPDSPLWPIKAIRDKIWLFVTRDDMKRAHLALLFADKRVGMAQVLLKGGKSSLAVATASKAEKYLEQAFLEQDKAIKRGANTASFLQTLAKASIRHRQVIEDMVLLAPEDAKPELNKILDYPKGVYEKAMQALNERGITPPTPTPEPQK